MPKKHNVAVVGGGSTYTLGLVGSFLAERDNFDIGRLTFFDTDGKRQKPMAEATKIVLKNMAPDIEFEYTDSNKELAYKGCDFVFIQIREGGLEMRSQDEKIPLSLGIVGQETCGPGGYSYGLRSIGSLIEIVRDVRKYAPHAWIINYTNPAAIVALALNREFPDDRRIFNLCDMPFGIMEAFANLLGQKSYDLVPEYFGLNHYGWFTGLYDSSGNDLIPSIRTALAGKVSAAVLNIEKSTEKSWEDTYRHLITMCRDMPGYIPNTYFQYYLYPEEMVKKSDSKYTRADEVIACREKHEFEIAHKIIEQNSLDGISITGDLHGRYIIQVVSALASNKGKSHIIIVPNKGTIPCLPSDAMVEVDCYVDSRGPRPFSIKEVPLFHRAMLQNQYAAEALVVESWYEGNRQKLIEALTLNRTVVDLPKAQKLAEMILEANKQWLPQFS